MKNPAPAPRLDMDLHPVTEFRANTASLIARVRSTGRPLVLTQHGRGAVVVLDVAVYEQIVAARSEPTGATGSVPALDAAAAFKPAVDRSLLQDNLGRTHAERLRRLEELARFASDLREAKRKPARRPIGDEPDDSP